MTRHDVLLTVISLLSFLGTLFALGVNGMLAVHLRRARSAEAGMTPCLWSGGLQPAEQVDSPAG